MPVEGHPTQAAWAMPGPLQCRHCGWVPAVEATFRGHQGMIIWMQFLEMKGPFCRDCGMATFRDMTARTLLQGWYGYISFAATPIAVVINLFRRGKVADLPAPSPPAWGDHGRPMDPGAPLLRRPMALIGMVVPFVLVPLVVLMVLSSD
jgi:hypothetical protein